MRDMDPAWGSRRRMAGGDVITIQVLSGAVELAERHISRHLRLANLAPEGRKRLFDMREVPALAQLKLSEVAALPWYERDESPQRAFD